MNEKNNWANWIFGIVVMSVFLFTAYQMGRLDYTNELACARSIVKHHEDEAEFFYKKWREEESANFKLQIKLNQLQNRLKERQ